MSRGALADLALRLQAFREGIAASDGWCAAPAMADALAMIQGRHRRAAPTVNRGRILNLVASYLNTGRVSRPADLFELCLGAGWLDGAGCGILANPPLLRRLLDLAETATGRFKRLRAFRNLLHAYWSFPLHDDATPPQAIAGWRELRDWLGSRYAAIARHPARKPTWFRVLAPHRHLLEEYPCARYAAALRRGDLDELQHAMDCLFIPAESWLKTEAVMAQIAAATRSDDADFRAQLPAALRLATGAAGIQVTAGVTRRAVAQLVARYARQSRIDAHEELFALAVERIGNPWRRQTAWDADVRDAGGAPCALSRAMVDAWLKDRIIAGFFADSDEAAARSAFWQRYAVFMAALAVAEKRALLARLGNLLVVIPHDRAEPAAAYPWPALARYGGARLFDADAVDGAMLQSVLGKRKPATHLSQLDPAAGESALRGLLFASAPAAPRER